MTRKKTFSVSRILFPLLLCLLLIFIFGQSMLPRAASKEESETVLGFCSRFSSLLGINFLTDHIIRKAAHFIEYTCLGVLLFLNVRLFQSGNSRLRLLFTSFSLGLMTAVADESIQILSGRGPMVQDILLDCTGVLTGMLLFFLFSLLPRRHS